jgi:hypothetical protein
MNLPYLKHTFTIAIAGGIFAALVALLVRLTLTPTCEAFPDLYVVQPTIDLGELQDGDARDVEFRILNRGERRLVINRLERECGCDSPNSVTTVIPPNSEDKISVRLDTRDAKGLTEQIARFTTNDPNHPHLTLTLRAIVPASINATNFVHPIKDNTHSVLISD